MELCESVQEGDLERKSKFVKFIHFKSSQKAKRVVSPNSQNLLQMQLCAKRKCPKAQILSLSEFEAKSLDLKRTMLVNAKRYIAKELRTYT